MKRISWSELSYLDLFGIISGTIGLICNLIGLPTLLITSQKVQVSGTEFWILVFVFVFLLIVYTTFIVNIYTRRSLYIRYKRNLRALTVKQREKLESGTLVITWLAGLTLLYVFTTSILILEHANHPEHFKNPNTGGYGEAVVGIVIFLLLTTVLGVLGCNGVHELGKLVYSAFDPEYK